MRTKPIFRRRRTLLGDASALCTLTQLNAPATAQVQTTNLTLSLGGTGPGGLDGAFTITSVAGGENELALTGGAVPGPVSFTGSFDQSSGGPIFLNVIMGSAGPQTLNSADAIQGRVLLQTGTIILGGNTFRDAPLAFMVGTLRTTGGGQVPIRNLSGGPGGIEMANGNILLRQDVDGTYTGIISGAGGATFEKYGTGELSLNGGSVDAGITMVAAEGAVMLRSGQFLGSVNIQPSGTFGGYGQAGQILNAGGRLQVGALTLANTTLRAASYTASAGSQMVFTLNNTRSALLIVTGNADFANTTLALRPIDAGFVAGTNYRLVEVQGVISNDASITGTISTIVGDFVVATNGQFIDAQLVSVTGAPGAPGAPGGTGLAESFGQTANQRATGRALDSLPAGGDLGLAYSDFQLLPNAAEASRALDAISGDTHNMASEVLRLQAARPSRIANARLTRLSAGGSEADTAQLAYASEDQMAVLLHSATEGGKLQRGGWIESYGEWTRASGKLGVDSNDFGIQGGADQLFAEGLTLGATAGFGSSDIDFAGREANAAIQSYNLGAYAAYENGPWTATGALSYGLHNIEAERRIRIQTIDRIASADFTDHSVTASVEGGYRFDVTPRAQITPFAGLRSTTLFQNGFTETGAGGLNLKYEDETDTRFTSTLGLRGSYDLALKGAEKVNLFGSLAWEHDFGDSGTRPVSFSAAPANGFLIEDPQDGGDAALLGFGVNYAVSEDVGLNLRYQGRYDGDDASHGVIAGVRFTW